MLLALLLASTTLAADDSTADEPDRRPPEPIHRVYPNYPEGGLSEEQQGQICELRANIDLEGVPTEVRAEDCPEAFVQLSVDALSQWRFRPGQVQGEDAPSEYVVRFEFRQTNHPGGPSAEELAEVEGHDYVPVKVTHRVAPRYPRAAYGLSLASHTCKVRVHVDAKGQPSAVQPEDCLADFVQPTIDAVMQWRFQPAGIDGKPYPSQFFVNVAY